jgi:hypothetical protein
MGWVHTLTEMSFNMVVYHFLLISVDACVSKEYQKCHCNPFGDKACGMLRIRNKYVSVTALKQ